MKKVSSGRNPTLFTTTSKSIIVIYAVGFCLFICFVLNIEWKLNAVPWLTSLTMAGPALIAEGKKALPLTTQCFSTLPWFENEAWVCEKFASDSGQEVKRWLSPGTQVFPITYNWIVPTLKEGRNWGLRRFQQLRSYHDEIETRNREEIPYSSRIAPRGLSVAEGP